MWKCVKCEMNNPDSSGSCFICGTEKSYSLRLAEEMKKTADFVKEEPVIHTKPEEDKKSAERSSGAAETVKDDIFGDAVYTRTHEPHMEKFSVPEETSPAEKSDSSEPYEEDEYFLYELEREKREKGSKRIKETVLVIVLIILVFSILLEYMKAPAVTKPNPKQPSLPYISPKSQTKPAQRQQMKRNI